MEKYQEILLENKKLKDEILTELKTFEDELELKAEVILQLKELLASKEEIISTLNHEKYKLGEKNLILEKNSKEKISSYEFFLNQQNLEKNELISELERIKTENILLKKSSSDSEELIKKLSEEIDYYKSQLKDFEEEKESFKANIMKELDFLEKEIDSKEKSFQDKEKLLSENAQRLKEVLEQNDHLKIEHERLKGEFNLVCHKYEQVMKILSEHNFFQLSQGLKRYLFKFPNLLKLYLFQLFQKKIFG